MNKIILSLAIVGLLSFGALAHAESTCTTENPCGNGSPESVMNVWGTTNSQIPHVAPGATITDEGGVPSTCPAWFSNYCADISHTTYYRNSMLALGHQLKALGYTGGLFGYWINLAQ